MTDVRLYFAVNLLLAIGPKMKMSRTNLKKDSSYSEFRKNNSLSKNNLHKSMLDVENSISIIADDKTDQLLSLQNELQSMVRNRSLSAKPSPRNHTEESLKFIVEHKQQTIEEVPLHIVKRNSIHALTTMDNYQKTHRSIQFQPFNENFEIIEQSEIHNEQDNGQEQGNKITQAKTGTKNTKTALNRRKNSNHLAPGAKVEKKVTINELDQMEKRLESAKKKNKIELKDIVNAKKVVKKAELASKPIIPQKTQRRIHRTNSEAVMVTERTGFKGMEHASEKETLTPKPVIKKKFTLSDSVKLQMAQKQASNELIPTKLVSSEQKQKLLKEFDRIKDSVKSTDICADNMDGIRKMLKTIQGLIS